MGKEVERLIGLLYSKNNTEACGAMKILEQMSEHGNSVYPYMNIFIEMTDHANSYIRNRGLLLTASNARWDTDFRIDENIDSYLKHINDTKPITARQCIKSLYIITRHKPELAECVIAALERADISAYKDSMQPLISEDIRKLLSEMKSGAK